MRYQFIPHVYSLAHIAREQLRPIARPALFEFPEWKQPAGAEPDAWGTWHTYMFGSHIVAADLGFKDGAAKAENSSVVALPPGQWFKLNSTATVAGDAVVRETLALADFPVYVRPGAILTLNARKVQYSAAQGGALEVQVYGGESCLHAPAACCWTACVVNQQLYVLSPGADCETPRLFSGADGVFTMFEDDGATLDYKKGGAALRKTTYTWAEGSKTLSWAASTAPIASGVAYTSLEVVYFEAGAAAAKRSPSTPIGLEGSVKMP